MAKTLLLGWAMLAVVAALCSPVVVGSRVEPASVPCPGNCTSPDRGMCLVGVCVGSVRGKGCGVAWCGVD